MDGSPSKTGQRTGKATNFGRCGSEKQKRTNARKRDGKGFRRDELIGLINEASRTFRPVDDSFVNYVPWNYIAMLVRGITMNRVS